MLLDLPEQTDPGAERALWTRRAVLVQAWRHAWNWNLLDCAFEFDVTLPAMLRAFAEHGLDVPPDPTPETHDRLCSACGIWIRASRFIRLCTGCGGCGETLVEIARKDAAKVARRAVRSDAP